MSENNGLSLDRSIYLMPMFANLVVRDLARAERLYNRAGFVPLATVPARKGTVQLVHLRRLKFQDLLLTEGEPLSGSVSVSFAAGECDLSVVAEELPEGGVDVDGPTDTAWFTSEVTFTDHDGKHVILTAPRHVDADQAKAWTRDHITGDFNV